MQPHHLHELLETTFRGSTVLFRPWRSFHTSTCIKQWCLYCRKHWTSLGHLKTSWKFVNKRVNCDISSEHRWKDLCCQCGWPKKKIFFFNCIPMTSVCDITSCSLSCFLLLAWTVYHKLVKYRSPAMWCSHKKECLCYLLKIWQS